MDAFITLELARGLNTLPGRCNFDKHTFLFDSNRIVKSNKFPGLGLGCLLVKGETGIDFGRDTAGNDGKNLFTKFDELQFHISGGLSENCLKTNKAVNSGFDLLMDISTLSLAVCNCDIDQAGVSGFVRRSK